MSVDDKRPNGTASIREVYRLLDEHEEADEARTTELRRWLESKFSEIAEEFRSMDSRYTSRRECDKTHLVLAEDVRENREVKKRVYIIFGVGVAVPALTSLAALALSILQTMSHGF